MEMAELEEPGGLPPTTPLQKEQLDLLKYLYQELNLRGSLRAEGDPYVAAFILRIIQS